ncbi:MAG TPA: dihydrodipicolinate synthase family protein [Candidatus Acidoferrum sp.]|nr:dihydrodipicolinate synthase family protein [Candidatus Acidoferrum sp.]
MKNASKYCGAVIPMITPLTASGELDEAAVDRLVDSLVAGGVRGVFVLGTTGEGVHVPKAFRRQLVRRTADRVKDRCLVYAGLGDLQTSEFASANDYFRDGAHVVVAHPPISSPVAEAGLADWYRLLLGQLEGPLILYNIPMTTGVSIPLAAVEMLRGHPWLAGIKDSENNPGRHDELIRRFGGRADFAIFVGVGALMENGLKLGAQGIVPSVGNLIPDVCQNLCAAAERGDWKAADDHFSRMNAVAALYQRGRSLNESLSLLKAAVSCCGFCAPHVLPPLRPVSESELIALRSQMARLHLLNGKS